MAEELADELHAVVLHLAQAFGPEVEVLLGWLAVEGQEVELADEDCGVIATAVEELVAGEQSGLDIAQGAAKANSFEVGRKACRVWFAAEVLAVPVGDEGGGVLAVGAGGHWGHGKVDAIGDEGVEDIDALVGHGQDAGALDEAGLGEITAAGFNLGLVVGEVERPGKAGEILLPGLGDGGVGSAAHPLAVEAHFEGGAGQDADRWVVVDHAGERGHSPDRCAGHPRGLGGRADGYIVDYQPTGALL